MERVNIRTLILRANVRYCLLERVLLSKMDFGFHTIGVLKERTLEIVYLVHLVHIRISGAWHNAINVHLDITKTRVVNLSAKVVLQDVTAMKQASMLLTIALYVCQVNINASLVNQSVLIVRVDIARAILRC